MATTELSLFTGAGGGVWGTKLLGWKTVGYVERDEYCQKVIAQRIGDGVFDIAPIFSDIQTFNAMGYARSYTGLVDVVTAGFPCQPFSAAGKRLGEDDPRNMWPATAECISHVRPKFALLENVPALTASPYFGRIIGDLTELGYDCRWSVISAAELGAPHLRRRLWILATDSNSPSGRIQPRRGIGSHRKDSPQPRHDGARQLGWSSQSGVCRVANGVADRSNRLRALGNGQVPRVVAEAWERLRE